MSIKAHCLQIAGILFALIIVLLAGTSQMGASADIGHIATHGAPFVTPNVNGPTGARRIPEGGMPCGARSAPKQVYGAIHPFALRHIDCAPFGFGPTTSIRAPFDPLSLGAHSTNSNSPVGTYVPIGGTITPTDTPDPCAPAWGVVDSPNAGLIVFLYSTAAAAANDVWAVGEYHNPGERTLVEHWDGIAWSVVPSPSPGDNSYLDGVAVVAPNDVWAVGGSDAQTLVEHWDGTAWSIVPSPNIANGGYFNSVAAAPDDVWAVGCNFANNGTCQTLVEHWDGTAWSILPSPNPSSDYDELYSVAAVGANDVWAVGISQRVGSGFFQALAVHWDGTAWSVSPSPNVGGSGDYLEGVAAVAANDIWAVGFLIDSSGFSPLAEHWDGNAWSVVPSPNIDNSGDLLKISILSANDIWAVGDYYDTSIHVGQTLIEHWDGTAWSIVPSPNVDYDYLKGITVIGANDAWAVGSYRNGSWEHHPLAEHWDGTAWTVVSTPNNGVGTGLNYLYDVAAVTASDVWAVGISYSDNGLFQTLVEHWNGTTWSIVPSPSVGLASLLRAVAAVGANDVWAAGYYESDIDGSVHTLVEHWDGTAWSIVPSQDLGNTSYLQAVHAVATNDVWAVGAYDGQTLVEHWDGAAWSVVPSPNFGNSDSLQDVAAASGSDVWAIGNSFDGTVNRTLTEHWNGTAWSIVPSPNPGSTENYLWSVTEVAANDVWSVGYYYNGSMYQTLTEHWDGTTWSAIPSANGALDDGLFGVEAVAADDVWAFGKIGDLGGSQPLVEHWDGTAWSIVTNPDLGTGDIELVKAAVVGADDVWAVGDNEAETLVERYSSPCNTPSPTTTTTSTPTSCTLEFTDVPPDSTFYPFIRCIACRGIISGYASGCQTGNPCFRPGNNVTRGQLSKIISNAAGFVDPEPSQIFEDVPVNSPFQVFVGRLASRGYINGYSCGGPGEPCNPPGNLPYFRPNAEATRGQISKIVSNAATLFDRPIGQQFEDVQEGSTYYTYTYRLTSHSIMSGYPCGVPTEPCVFPGNRPYFRPNSNATRGQTSKLVANTFFPNCQTP